MPRCSSHTIHAQDLVHLPLDFLRPGRVLLLEPGHGGLLSTHHLLVPVVHLALVEADGTVDWKEAHVAHERLLVNVRLDAVELRLVLHLADVDQVVHIHPHVVLVLRVVVKPTRGRGVELIAVDATNKTLVLDVLQSLLPRLSQRLERVDDDAKDDLESDGADHDEKEEGVDHADEDLASWPFSEDIAARLDLRVRVLNLIEPPLVLAVALHTLIRPRRTRLAPIQPGIRTR
mmetsp:Transcript_2153/g.5033  ORF Transcript_2153/g.5033 Transcript_2153/m.5033 type:complete len:232 (+) Transcript_2153:499-1194(+)